MALAEFVQARLDHLGISQAEAARRCRVSGTLMHNILAGKHQVPRPETMEKLATGLQLGIAKLYQAAGVSFPAHSQSSPVIRLAESVALTPGEEQLLLVLEKDHARWEALSEGLRDTIRALLRMAAV